jgi:hypothetical protein
MIPAQWLPSLPPPANGWLPVHYEVSEETGTLRQGEYRVDGDRVWARNDVGVRFLPREKHLDDVVVARRVLHLLDHGLWPALPVGCRLLLDYPWGLCAFVVIAALRPDVPIWQERLYAFTTRNAGRAP